MSDELGQAREGMPAEAAHLRKASPESIRDILLDAAGMSPQRLPMLPVIFQRFADTCGENLKRFLSGPAKLVPGKVENARMAEAIRHYDNNAIAGVFNVEGWDGDIVVGLDRAAVFTLMEAMFGSDGSEPAVNDGGEFSHIEKRVVQTVFSDLGRAIQSAFADIVSIMVTWDRSETEMEYAAVTRPGSLVLTATFRLEALSRGGEMFVVIPQAALMPLRQRLSVVPADETPAHDPKWSSLIRGEVTRTAVAVHAVIEERHLPLAEVAAFKVGQVIELEATASSRVKIASQDQQLYWGHLGQAGGTYTLRIEDLIDPRQETMAHVLLR
jgi:flagellar motor switch protein FliM